MRFFCLLVAALAIVPGAVAQTLEPIRYTLKFPAPQTHYVEVEASVPTEGKPRIEMMMAVWTPGSYLIREYARNVENVKADAGGRPLAMEKSRKNHWAIETGGAARIHFSYRAYCREMATQTCFVEAGFAMLNGAPTFMTLAGSKPRAHEVEVVLPSSWSRVMTGLEGGPLKYSAPDFDTLIDSPIVAGNPAVYEWEIDGKKHYLVNTGEAGIFDGAKAAKDVEKIVLEYRRMFGSLPYSKYVFINMLTEAGGGTEHKNSVLMIGSKWATRYQSDATEAPPAAEGAAPGARRPTYSGWLGLASHEYFHCFNVKRLRPIELGPFDYDNEIYSRSLWVSEGFTSYYGPLAVRRAGLTNRDEFLRTLGTAITQLQSTPGRLVTPVEQASFDAWIKHYRPNENSPNTTISYYTKGEVIGFLLDAKIRKATNGAKSLDDMMKLAYERFGGPRGFTVADFRKTASEIAGQDLGAWFRSALETTDELDYSEALDWFGLRFRDLPARGPAPRVTHGATLTGLVVSQLRRGTPAYDAGLNAGDEIIAVDNFRVTPANFQTRLEAFKPGDTVTLLIARRDELIKIPIKLAASPKTWGRLDVRPDATEEQKAHLRAWLMD